MARRIDQLPPVHELPIDYAPPRTRRPRIVGFVGWICAGIGYMSFFLKGSQLPSYFFPDFVKTHINPEWNPPPYTRGQFSLAVFMLLAEMVIAIASMSGGLGALKMREWGRRLLIYYGIAAIVMTLLKSAFQIYYFDFMLDYQIAATTHPVDRIVEGNKEFFALILSTAMQLTWPLIVISIMTRRYVKDAFDAVRLGDGASEGWQSPTP